MKSFESCLMIHSLLLEISPSVGRSQFTILMLILKEIQRVN